MSGGEDVIQSVLGTRCYYARLGVSRSADEDEIRKAYKKRAMKLHPDRNKHPRAEEAFKLVGTAHTVLVDPAKRREYDQVGEEGMNGGGGHTFQRGFNRRGQAVHPEDIFDIFDILRGAHVQRQQQRQRHHAHAPQGPPPNQALLNFINMFPLIIMLGVYLLSGMGIGGHDSLPFSLDRNIERGFVIERKTNQGGIPYYVKSSFLREYGSRRAAVREVDRSVTEAYQSHLFKKCNTERHNRKVRMDKARGYANSEAMLAKAQNMKTPSCTEYQRRFGNTRTQRR